MSNAQSDNKFNYEIADTLTHVKLSVKVLGNNVYCLVPLNDDSKRYLPMNMPDALMKENIKLRCTLYTGKPAPNVRMMGTPAWLVEVKVLGSFKKTGVKERLYLFNLE